MQRITAVIIGAIVCFLGLTWLFLGFRDEKISNDSEKVSVLVTILPQKQIVERVGGNHTVVNTLIPPGANHETYEPTIEEVARVSTADLWLQIGTLPFDSTHKDTALGINPKLEIVNTAASLTLSNEDPHVWLSPDLVKEQALVVAETLKRIDPKNSTEYDNNLQQLNSELDQLSTDLGIILAPLKDKAILVYHPELGYLAERYGFKQLFIEVEGKEPSLQDIKATLLQAKAQGITSIFVQHEFDPATAQAVAEELGGKVVTVETFGEDYFATMRGLAYTLVE